MSYERTVIRQLMQQMKKLSGPFHKMEDKGKFINKFCNQMEKKKKTKGETLRICEQFLESFLSNRVGTHPPCWMNSDDQHLYEQLRKLFGKNNVHICKGNNKWKIPFLRFLKDHPKYLRQGKLDDQMRATLFDVVKKNKYTGNIKNFKEDKKNFIKTLREVQYIPRWVDSKEETELFHAVKKILDEIDKKNGRRSLICQIKMEAKKENNGDTPSSPTIFINVSEEEANENDEKKENISPKVRNKKDLIPEIKEKGEEFQEIEEQKSYNPIWNERISVEAPEGSALESVYQSLGDIEDTKINVARRNFHVEYPIGTGAFSIVYKAKDKATNKKIAIKFSKENDSEELINLLRPMNNKYIAMSEIITEWMPSVYVQVMELADTDLFELNCNDVQFSSLQILHLMAQLASAVGAIHDCGYIYTDIKPENILLYNVQPFTDDKGQKRIKKIISKLTDFNTCLKMARNDVPFHNHTIQTYHYRAPEVIMKTPYNSKIDSWSLGMLAFHQLFWDKCLYEDYQDKTGAAQILCQMHYEIGGIRNHLFGDPEIAEMFSQMVIDKRSYKKNMMKDLLATLPNRIHSQNLKNFIIKNLHIDPTKRNSVREMRDYLIECLQD